MVLKVISTGSTRGNCYSITADNGEMLLLDFGCSWKKILKGIDYQISKVSGALLTHRHADHAESYMWLFQNGIPIYTSDETAEHFKIVTGELMKGVPDKQWFEVGSFQILPFYVPHDDCPNFAYLIQLPDRSKLLYATDFSYLPVSLKRMKVEHWLIECNHMDELTDREEVKYSHSIRGHSSLNTVLEIMKVNRTSSMRNVILCHLSEGWSDAERMKKEVHKVIGSGVNIDVAKPGLEVKLSLTPF